MSAFPYFSNVPDYVREELNKRIKDPSVVNKYNAWVRVSSGAGPGLSVLSNPDFDLFSAAGDKKSIYGGFNSSGTIGTTWWGSAIIGGAQSGGDVGFRPRPTITSIEIDEGAGNLSRKASFTITAYTEAQLNTLSKYFLEPGFTIFLEWGWNVPESLVAYESKLTGESVAKNQSFEEVNTKRQNSKGMYDNYLGFITGGSIGINGTFWEINVKCTGFTELPAYLMVSDNHGEGALVNANGDLVDKNGNPIEEPSIAYEPSEITGEKDLNRKRFMMMFNALPSSRQTQAVKDLIVDTNIAHAVNFINFDEKIKTDLNKKSEGTEILGFSLNDEEVETEGASVEVPSGTKLVSDDSFIRFGTLMEIINTMGLEAYNLGNLNIEISIVSKRTIVSAFPKIFSTNKGKLFIPNSTVPQFSLKKAAESTKPQSNFKKTNDCSIKYSDKVVEFPSNKKIENGAVDGVIIQPKLKGVDGINRAEKTWGFLDDLYVNFDMVKNIIDTKNFSIKDALYQILNNISSAAGGMWDFQIIETTNLEKTSTHLEIVELNMVPENMGEEPITFNIIGNNSIFMDASFDLDISGAKMNQIIGNRLGSKVNGSMPSTAGKLFAIGLKDKVLTAIQAKEKKKNVYKPTKGADDEKLKEKNLQLFLGKLGTFPRVEFSDSISGTLEEMAYIACYNDQVVFDALKNSLDVDYEKKPSVSTLMPIKFSFTIHGVSGIRRGDKFRVKGIPRQYATGGFFQVTSVKHTIENMVWKTDIEGGFRIERK